VRFQPSRCYQPQRGKKNRFVLCSVPFCEEQKFLCSRSFKIRSAPICFRAPYDEKRKKVFDLERAERPRFLWSQPHLRWKESATEPLSPDEKQGAVQRPSLLPSRMEEGEQISTVRAPFSRLEE
ncbi:unnamed protein product, partial [Musa hybrid cultivar]